MYVLKLFLFVCLVTIKMSDAYLNETSTVLGTCCIHDESFNSCYAANLKNILSEKFGCSVDPLFIKRVTMINAKTANININVTYSNIIVKGIKAAIFKDARLLTNNDCSTKITILLPNISITAEYSVNGMGFSYPVNSEGTIFFEIDDIFAELYVPCKLSDKDGCTVATIEAVKVDLRKIRKFYINWDIVSGGDKVLEKKVQALSNKNWRETWELYRSTFQETMEPILLNRYKMIANSVTFSCLADEDEPYWN